MQRRKLLKFLDDEIRQAVTREEEAHAEVIHAPTLSNHNKHQYQKGFRAALRIIRDLTERKQIG